MDSFEDYLNSDGGLLLNCYKDIIHELDKGALLLQHKVFFLLILQATSKEIINAMEDCGLSKILIEWFNEANEERNAEFMLELLKTLPLVSSANVLVEDVRNLLSFGNTNITKSADSLIKLWMKEKDEKDKIMEANKPKFVRPRYSTVLRQKTKLRSAGIEEEYSPPRENVKRKIPLREIIRQPEEKLFEEVELITPLNKKSKGKRVSWASPNKMCHTYYYEKNDFEADSSTSSNKSKVDGFPGKQNVLKQKNTSQSRKLSNSLDDSETAVSSSSGNDNENNSENQKLNFAKHLYDFLSKNTPNPESLTPSQVYTILHNSKDNGALAEILSSGDDKLKLTAPNIFRN